METKICKKCNIEKDKKKYSGRSAVCCACVYAPRKEKSKEYYQNNKEHIIARVLEIWHFRHDDLPKQKRGRKKILLVKPESIE